MSGLNCRSPRSSWSNKLTRRMRSAFSADTQGIFRLIISFPTKIVLQAIALWVGQGPGVKLLLPYKHVQPRLPFLGDSDVKSDSW